MLVLLATALGLFFGSWLFPKLEFGLRLLLKARNDYRTARGTIHLKLLRKSLNNLQMRIKEEKKCLEKLRKYKMNLNYQRRKELEVAASTYLFNSEFTSIPGIGPILKERVMKNCFDGTLQSIRRAWMVRGIGEERAHSINLWVDRAQRKLSYLIMSGYFPGKDEINKKYDLLEKETEQRIVNAENLLREMLELKKIALKEVKKLRQVTISTFIKSYRGNPQASKAVTTYMMGCFPEWGKIPEWFKTLMEKYGNP